MPFCSVIPPVVTRCPRALFTGSPLPRPLPTPVLCELERLLPYVARLSCSEEQKFEESWWGGVALLWQRPHSLVCQVIIAGGGGSCSVRSSGGKLGHRTARQPRSRCPSNGGHRNTIFQALIPGRGCLVVSRPIPWGHQVIGSHKANHFSSHS